MLPVLAPVGDSPYVGAMYCAACGQLRDTDSDICQDCGSLVGPEAGQDFGGAGETGQPLWGVWQAATATIALWVGLFAAAITAEFVAGAIVGDGPHELALSTWIAVHLVALVVAGLVWGFGARQARSPALALGLGPPTAPAGIAALFALAALAVSLGFTMSYGLLVQATGPEFLAPPEIDEGIIFRGAGIVLSLEALVLMTPLAEEVFFRGFVFAGLLPRLGPVPTIVLTSLVFSAFHFEPGVLIPIFVTGAALAWLYWRTGSIWPGIAAHAGQNALAILAASLGG